MAKMANVRDLEQTCVPASRVIGCIITSAYSRIVVEVSQLDRLIPKIRSEHDR